MQMGVMGKEYRPPETTNTMSYADYLKRAREEYYAEQKETSGRQTRRPSHG